MSIDTKKLRAVAEKATQGEWQWYGNTKMHEVYLATVDRGRTFVMQFERWGMTGAQPRFQIHIGGAGIMRSLKELADNGPRMLAPHRKEFVGIAHPDAEHIAAFSPATALALLDRLETAERDIKRWEALGEKHDLALRDSPCSVHVESES